MLAYCVSCECYFRYLQRQGIFFKRESNKRRDNVKKSSWLSWLWQRRSTKLHSSIPPKCTSSSSLILPAPPKLAAGHWRPSGLERPYLQVQQKCIGPSRRLKCRSRKRENRRFARRHRESRRRRSGIVPSSWWKSSFSADEVTDRRGEKRKKTPRKGWTQPL